MRAAAFLLAFACLAASAQTPVIGRLFTTPAERARLDLQRAGVSVAAPPLAPMEIAEPRIDTPAPAAAPVQVDGIVRRSSGKTTVWLNQTPHEAPAGTATGAYPVPLPNGGRVQLKPGQSVDPATGVRKDLYAPD
jgi:hypothetical protein